MAILLQQLGLVDLGPPVTGPVTLALFVIVGGVLFAVYGFWVERRMAPRETAIAPATTTVPDEPATDRPAETGPDASRPDPASPP